MIDGIYILLGSNLADKIKNLQSASNEIIKHIGPIVNSSSIYESEPWGKCDQPVFCNQVLEIRSCLTPEAMLEVVLQIESRLGRVRHEKWGERIIDIDILYYKDKTINQPNLVVPHPGIPDRRFTLIPLCEIAPDFIHPALETTNATLLNDCTDRLNVSIVA